MQESCKITSACSDSIWEPLHTFIIPRTTKIIYFTNRKHILGQTSCWAEQIQFNTLSHSIPLIHSPIKGNITVPTTEGSITPQADDSNHQFGALSLLILMANKENFWMAKALSPWGHVPPSHGEKNWQSWNLRGASIRETLRSRYFCCLLMFCCYCFL